MLDPTRALADMANQIRESRIADGLTLQQLANRSGVAASTIHKVESQQMVPTVSVLLKIAKGLGCRPEELIRDGVFPEKDPVDDASAFSPTADHQEPKAASFANRSAKPQSGSAAALRSDIGIWHIVLEAEKLLPTLDLTPTQRALVLVKDGALDLHAGNQHIQMTTGDCIEIEGARIQSKRQQPHPTQLTLIVSPPGNLDLSLGQPSRAVPTI